VRRVIAATLQSKPAGSTHWSCLWTASVDSILAKLNRCRQTLEQIQPGCTAPKTRKRKSS